MQIILLEKVVNLGDLGEIVKVKDGYARNFLIPGKHARRATEAAIAEFAPKPTRRLSKPAVPNWKKSLLPSWPKRKPRVKSSLAARSS